jgi:hypothetical protein
MRSRRSTGELPDSVLRLLHMYSVAASAAGVSVLALAPSAAAKIVYTPAYVQIGKNQEYKIDLNVDGTPDFTIRDSVHTYTRCGYRRRLSKDRLSVIPLHRDGVEAWFHSALALAKGTPIGHSRGFQSGSANMATHIFGHTPGLYGACDSVNHYGGYWLNVTDRYLGLKFILHGKTHYGWARLTVGTGLAATLTGYAYETIPGKSIKAGQRHEG